MQFKYKPGRGVPHIAAQTVGDELARIETEFGLTPASVVEVSKPETAVLHPVFEWDDPTAAINYRLHQARQIVNCVLVVPDTGEKKPVQAFVSVSILEEDTDERSRRYVSASNVVVDDDLRLQHLATLRSKLRNLRDEISAFEEFGAVVKAIDRSI